MSIRFPGREIGEFYMREDLGFPPFYFVPPAPVVTIKALAYTSGIESHILS
jgi:hypothetical protein